jgi:ABC-type phosphate transport system substrate-binding protein
MRWHRRVGLGLVALVSLLPRLAAAADVVFVVHPRNPQSDISSSDLVQILRMEQQHWDAGGRIYLVLQESDTPEKELVLKKLYRMKDAALKLHYLEKLYRGEIASFPRIAHSNSAVKKIVAQAPNALGFIDAAAVDSTVKVLRIDGKKPGEPGYPLSPD